VINAEKCLFGVTEWDFLDHRVSATGASPLTAYVEAGGALPAADHSEGDQSVFWPHQLFPAIPSGTSGNSEAAYRCSPGVQEGRGRGSVDHGQGGGVHGSEARPRRRHTFGSSSPGSCHQPGHGRLRHARRSLPAAETARDSGVAAFRLLLQKAGRRPSQILCFRPRSSRLLPGDPPLPSSLGGPPVRVVHRPQATHARPGTDNRRLDGQAVPPVVLHRGVY